MEFIDANGEVIKSDKSKTAASSTPEPANEMRAPARGRAKEIVVPAKAGGNTFAWEDMRYTNPAPLEGIVTHGSARGPLIMPGKYSVRLTVDGKTYTEEFEIVKDPRSPITQEEYKEQFDLLVNIGKRVTEWRSGVMDIRNMRQQLDEAYKSSTGKKDKSIVEMKNKLLRVEDQLVQVKANQDLTNYPVRLDTKLIRLAGFVEYGDAKPTQQHHEKYNELTKKLQEQLEKLEELKSQFNQELRAYI